MPYVSYLFHVFAFMKVVEGVLHKSKLHRLVVSLPGNLSFNINSDILLSFKVGVEI